MWEYNIKIRTTIIMQAWDLVKILYGSAYFLVERNSKNIVTNDMGMKTTAIAPADL